MHYYAYLFQVFIQTFANNLMFHWGPKPLGGHVTGLLRKGEKKGVAFLLLQCQFSNLKIFNISYNHPKRALHNTSKKNFVFFFSTRSSVPNYWVHARSWSQSQISTPWNSLHLDRKWTLHLWTLHGNNFSSTPKLQSWESLEEIWVFLYKLALSGLRWEV